MLTETRSKVFQTINIYHLNSHNNGLSGLSGEVREFPVTLRWTETCLVHGETRGTELKSVAQILSRLLKRTELGITLLIHQSVQSKISAGFILK